MIALLLSFPKVEGDLDCLGKLDSDSLDPGHYGLSNKHKHKPRYREIEYTRRSRSIAIMSHSKDCRILSLPILDSLEASTSPESYLVRSSRTSSGSTCRSKSDLHASTMKGSFRIRRRSARRGLCEYALMDKYKQLTHQILHVLERGLSRCIVTDKNTIDLGCARG